MVMKDHPKIVLLFSDYNYPGGPIVDHYIDTLSYFLSRINETERKGVERKCEKCPYSHRIHY